MEQTIGKRIAQHRKRLGMTQDQLAHCSFGEIQVEYV